MSKVNIKIIFIIFVAIISLFSYNNNSYALGDLMKKSDDFITEGKKQEKNPIEQGRIDEASSVIYSTVTGIGMILAFGVGAMLGINYMVAGAEGKAKVKETFIPYVLGVAVLFGSFTIWRIAVKIANKF